MENMSVTSTLCETIPPGDYHAVSVSLPTWESNLQWAQKDESLMKQMKSGYPRFFVHSIIKQLAKVAGEKYCPPETESLPFTSAAAAERCRAWMAQHTGTGEIGTCSLRAKDSDCPLTVSPKWMSVHLVWFRPDRRILAKAYWQHTGDGISSRRAMFCLDHLEQLEVRSDGNAVGRLAIGADAAIDNSWVAGRYPREDEAEDAKRLIRERITSYLDPSATGVKLKKDVYLHLSGMKAIYDTFRAIISAFESSADRLTMVAFGFLYVDTFKIMSKLGPNSAILHGHGSTEELDQLESYLRGGNKICALFTEFPTNPLLTCVDLRRIRRLADEYNFVVVCDDTVGTLVNLDIFPHVDILVTSLTKMFSGACNVMGGSVVINPLSRYYQEIQSALDSIYEDMYFPEDAIVMSINCQDFDIRVGKINGNARAIASLLSSRTDLVKHLYYASAERSKAMYDTFKRPGHGYGYLLSIEFNDPESAIAFFDNLHVAKGPSLGTNFTLACPYTLLGHYGELEFAAEYGVVEHLVRISVGMEDDLLERVERALIAAAEAKT